MTILASVDQPHVKFRVDFQIYFLNHLITVWPIGPVSTSQLWPVKSVESSNSGKQRRARSEQEVDGKVAGMEWNKIFLSQMDIPLTNKT